MAIIISLVVFFLIFYLVRHRIGPTNLAVIAGLAINQMFGDNIVSIIHNVLSNVSEANIRGWIFLLLVVGFPLILYFRSGGHGLFGILRIGEGLLLSALLTILIAPTLASFFAFDSLATSILGTINSFKDPIVLIGIAGAYLDILLCKG